MRNQFADSLVELFPSNQDVVLLYSDSGNRLFDKLKSVDDKRVINVGIAEANMISVAAGMALSGHHPVTYAITPFTSSRNFEQIKVDIAYQNLPVTIVGTGSGLAYANLGPTHHSFEDIAMMRALPNMQVVCPADKYEIEALLPQVIASATPTYFRIGKKREPDLTRSIPPAALHQPSVLRSGADIALIAAGPVLKVAMDAAAMLAQKGVEAEVISMHTVKPLNQSYLCDLAARFTRIATIEEHSLVGGLGSALLEFYSDNELPMPIKRFGIPDRFIDRQASQADAWQSIGLDAKAITQELLQWL
jgi:transketolase